PGAQEAARGARRCTTMTRHDDQLIALLLDDRRCSPALGRWLGTLEGRRELAAYRRTLEVLEALYGDAGAAPRRTIYYCPLPTPIGRVFVAAGAWPLRACPTARWCRTARSRAASASRTGAARSARHSSTTRSPSSSPAIA